MIRIYRYRFIQAVYFFSTIAEHKTGLIRRCGRECAIV